MTPRLLTAAAIFLGASLSAEAATLPIPIIAAENFYGALAAAIGGDRVKVENVLISPDTDPHDFEPPPSVARMVADAGVAIMNGADYDSWMARLVEASNAPGRVVLNVAELTGKKPGDNPHLWYDPASMPALAEALAKALGTIDPDGAAQYEQNRAAYLAALVPLTAKEAEIRERFAGAPVTATEPVFGLMAKALGLEMRNEAFQIATMNDTEPSARDIAAFEDDLKNHKVKVLFYNSQVTDPTTEHLLGLAKAGGVAVVGVSETMPAGLTFAEWMLGELEATEKALAGPSS